MLGLPIGFLESSQADQTGLWGQKRCEYSLSRNGVATPPAVCSPVCCRVTEVTVAWITLALVSFSRLEQTSLLPPSTDHRMPWAPASAMAPGQRGKGVGRFS